MKDKILLQRHYVLLEEFPSEVDPKISAYYNSYLLINFGIQITNPEIVNDTVLLKLSKLFSLNVPDSFYANPQDTKYFNCDELYVEQVVSYVVGYGTDIGRVEIFKKVLPDYCVGDEMVLRTFEIINKEKADEILRDVAKSYCAYKRPFSDDEVKEFMYLVDEGYFDVTVPIECRDNIFYVAHTYPELGRGLDKKDVVKYSIHVFGDRSQNLKLMYEVDKDKAELIKEIIPYVHDCPLSKRQAKYYNKVCSLLGLKANASNENSPYRLAKLCLDKGDVLGVAKVFQNSGSLLPRNIKMLLSRCKDLEEAKSILSMMPKDNPSIMYQLLTTLELDSYGVSRTFRFFAHKMAKTHSETAYEMIHRKSALNEETKALVRKYLFDGLNEYYSSLPKLGKIYVSDEFARVALPINTSASGNGLDILPSGSRLKFDARYIRTFCYWNGVRDIDASSVMVKEETVYDGTTDNHFDENTLSWRTYNLKTFGHDALCSGDCTDIKGAEYQDIDTDAMYLRGYRYVVCCINGYGAMFDHGDIHAGLQIKNKIDTAAWDPKNIAFSMHIAGECRSFTNFAIDIKNKEIVFINLKSNYGCIVVPEQVDVARNYLTDSFLDFNMKSLISNLGELVENPEEAEYVFDRDYQGNENQKVIRPFDIQSLVELVNRK